MATMTTEQHEVDPGDRFASARRFPSRLDPPGTGGGAELGELYRPAGSWPAPADAPGRGTTDRRFRAGVAGRLAAARPPG